VTPSLLNRTCVGPVPGEASVADRVSETLRWLVLALPPLTSTLPDGPVASAQPMSRDQPPSMRVRNSPASS
jgi:hypothetical protein